VIWTYLEEKLHLAQAKEPMVAIDRWSQLLSEHVDEFRTIIGHDPPVRVAPLQVKWDFTLAKKVRPIRIHYTAAEKAYMEYYCEELAAKGLIFENPGARFVSEALVIPKVPNPVNVKEDWRLVVNLVRANAATEPIVTKLRLNKLNL
jgi:hypothetical protein